MNIRARPLHDRIVVRRDTPQERTKGGIYLVNSAKEEKRCGEVLAVGPGVIGPHGKIIEMGCKIGDKVIFGAYAGTEVVIDEEKYQIMRDGDIVCVVDPAAEIETGAMTNNRSEVHEHYAKS